MCVCEKLNVKSFLFILCFVVIFYLDVFRCFYLISSLCDSIFSLLLFSRIYLSIFQWIGCAQPHESNGSNECHWMDLHSIYWYIITILQLLFPMRNDCCRWFENCVRNTKINDVDFCIRFLILSFVEFSILVFVKLRIYVYFNKNSLGNGNHFSVE